MENNDVALDVPGEGAKPRRNVFYRVFRFYVDGFKSMTLGKTLWALILIKLFIMFAVLKVFFFPNQLSGFESDEQKADHIIKQWTEYVP